MILLNQISSLVLVGLIWTIQIVHYPLFAKVGEQNFFEYHSIHSNLISILVIPLMFFELGSSIYLASETKSIKQILGLVFVLVVWASTFFIQVPIHNELNKKFDLELIEKLVNTNWIRTFFWTAKGFLILWK
jgi:Na+/H+-dicarboxylate symporter